MDYEHSDEEESDRDDGDPISGTWDDMFMGSYFNVIGTQCRQRL